MSTTTATASRALDVPLGAAPDGTPVSWRLADAAGRPEHGLVLGGTAAGGTTALARIAAGAHTEGVSTVLVDVTGKSLRGWSSLPVSPTTVIGDWEALNGWFDTLLDTEDRDPLVVLVEGPVSLAVAPARWVDLLRRSAQLHVSVAARLYTPELATFGGEATLCSHLTEDQALILRLGGVAAALTARELGHAVREGDSPRPGLGVYRRGSESRRIEVTGL
ncbi:hypothetical protein ACIRPH_31510 [Nocardiopsis sp. NPDC101807]|uniref:hypothetical protein n=1 Tax=Nocardiopsis sp. NPDC101807 TaxID=3364339 RepID=UPI0037F452D9